MSIKQAYKYVLFLASLLTCILIQHLYSITFALDTNSNASSSWVTKNVNNNTNINLSETIEILENLLKNPQGNEIATIHTNLARAYEQKGDTGNAIAHFKQAATLYEQSKNEVKLIEVLIEQAQVNNYLGQFTKAIPLLEKAVALASKNKNAHLELAAWGVMGNSYSLSRKYELALSAYQKSLSLAESLGNANYITTALNNQVNVYRMLASWYESQAKLADSEGSNLEKERLLKLVSTNKNNAISATSRALSSSNGSNNLSRVKALLNALPLTPNSNQYEQEISSILAKLPNSRGKAYSLIKLAKYQENTDKINSLQQAASVSSNLGDLRTQSFALGELGQVYERQGNLNLAKDYARSAILTAQSTSSLDSLYRWQWQLGRIYSVNGNKAKAIDYYKQAIASLQGIRGDIASASKDLQFDIRDEVEPVYRQLIQLLLDSEDKKSISEALEVTKLLKLSELQNFFGDECLEIKSAFASPQVANNNAVITTFISNNKTYLILHAVNTFKSYTISIDSTVLQNKVRDFRFQIEDQINKKYIALSQELYNLLIKPIAVDLEELKPGKIVFVNDGILRNVPMAALYDGKHFLIEKYPISYALDQSSVEQSSQNFKPGLFFGLTESTLASSPLPNVEIEVENIQDIIGGTKVLGKDFTEINFDKQIERQNYSVIHIATHGEFKGTANSSSLQAYNSRISLQEFDDALRSRKEPLELLTLSACQTAAGDDRSTLGLAGLAARNGVKNILASLWFANDSDTAILMEDFYSQALRNNITKAEALRNAQLRVIRDRANHPGRWASFILIES